MIVWVLVVGVCFVVGGIFMNIIDIGLGSGAYIMGGLLIAAGTVILIIGTALHCYRKKHDGNNGAVTDVNRQPQPVPRYML